jgi:hypothetical protein
MKRTLMKLVGVCALSASVHAYTLSYEQSYMNAGGDTPSASSTVDLAAWAKYNSNSPVNLTVSSSGSNAYPATLNFGGAAVGMLTITSSSTAISSRNVIMVQNVKSMEALKIAPGVAANTTASVIEVLLPKAAAPKTIMYLPNADIDGAKVRVTFY